MLKQKPKVCPKKLQDAREKSGLTRENMAEALDMGYSAISNIELGLRRLSSDNLYIWAKLCHVDMSDLYSFKAHPKPMISV